jgi:hypothetical protein
MDCRIVSMKDPNVIYVVGATEDDVFSEKSSSSPSSSGGSTSGADAYVMKIDVRTLEEIWIQHITGVESESMVRGISCAVSANEDTIWVGGVVQNDALMEHADIIESYGGDDVFVVKLDSNTGKTIFTRQIGSTEDDGLAMRGGIVLDRDDNCIVVGNTYGSMYRVRAQDEVGTDGNNADDSYRAWISDVFVTTVAGSDGAISYPISHPEYVPQPGTGFGIDTSLPPKLIEKSSKSKKTKAALITSLLFLLLGSVSVALYIRNKPKLNRDASTDRSKVTLFLNEFNVEDIDLKHSATSGWHCFYSNDLAEGHNRRASEQRSPAFGVLSPLPSDRSKQSTFGSDPLLTAPLTSGSLMKELLFMQDDDDDDDKDALDNHRANYGGNRSRGSRSTKSRPGYNGLLGDYNTNWSDSQSDDQQSNEVWGKEIL